MTTHGSHFRSFMTPIVALILTIGGSLSLMSCGMKELTEVSEGGFTSGHAQFPNPSSCGECHVAIYEEWSRSPHARAFVSETFRQATDGYQFNECIGCHAPQPTLTSGRPMARTTQHDLGVVC